MTENDMGPFKGGMPHKLTDPEEVKQAIRTYFDLCDPHIQVQVVEGGVNQKGETIWYKREIMTEQKPYTTAGLARALGISRQTLLAYEDPDHYPDDMTAEDRQAILDSLMDAKRRVEEYAEGALFSPYSNGAKFSLTNNHKGWADKSVVETPNGLFGGAASLKVEVMPAPPADPAEADNHEGQPDGESHAPTEPDAGASAPASE